MNTNKIKNFKKGLKLAEEQREILIGLILGDGHLETQNRGRTYRLKIEQSIQHEKYVNWLYKNFKEWVLTPPRRKINYDKRFSKSTVSLYFNTISHASFRFYAQQFYKNRKKVVPKQICRWLTPLSLAVWFMDDGSVKSNRHRSKIINTQSFTKKEVGLLSVCLEKKFGIKSNLRRQKGKDWQIYLLSETVGKFYQLVKTYILPCMRYRLIKLD